MFFTILVKPENWGVGGLWKVLQTVETKEEARVLVDQAHSKGYKRTKIRSHRIPINQLSNYDNWSVTFSDGTVALLSKD